MKKETKLTEIQNNFFRELLKGEGKQIIMRARRCGWSHYWNSLIQGKTFVFKTVSDKGRFFKPELLPVDITRGKTGDCFDHCLIEALKSNGKYQYCEGFCFINNEWLHHAWLTDKEGNVAFDPTWKAADKTGKEVVMSMVEYYGVILDLPLVIKFVRETEYKSPLANYDKSPELAQKIYDTAR